MGKKDVNSILGDYEKLKTGIFRDKVNEIFRNHPNDHIAEMEKLGFEYLEDDNNDEEIEERNAHPENQRQRDLIAYFEGRKKLSEKIFESYSEENASEKPNYPLMRKYYKAANQTPQIAASLRVGQSSRQNRSTFRPGFLPRVRKHVSRCSWLITPRHVSSRRTLRHFQNWPKIFIIPQVLMVTRHIMPFGSCLNRRQTKEKSLISLIAEDEEAEKRASQPVEF